MACEPQQKVVASGSDLLVSLNLQFEVALQKNVIAVGVSSLVAR
jgi:hypothetical protein